MWSISPSMKSTLSNLESWKSRHLTLASEKVASSSLRARKAE